MFQSNKSDLIYAFEENIVKLEKVFQSNINDYFYTEKELHSYFYHLALKSDLFNCHNHYLIHTEYPSPFKFSFLKSDPFLEQKNPSSKAQRGHIDCVLINPKFVSWLRDRGNGIKEMTGIGAQRFDLYINSFYKTYANFNSETGEPILLYALEFKFLRHTYAGSKYPEIAIHQDIAKLKLLKTFKTETDRKINFVDRTKAIIFVGERTAKTGKTIRDKLSIYNPDDYSIIIKQES